MARNLTEAAREMGVSLAALLAANPQIKNPNIVTPAQLRDLNEPRSRTVSRQESARQLSRVFSNPLVSGELPGGTVGVDTGTPVSAATPETSVSQSFPGFGTIIGTPPTGGAALSSRIPQLTPGGRAQFTPRPPGPQPGEGQPFQGGPTGEPEPGGGIFPRPGSAAFNRRTGAPSRPFRPSAGGFRDISDEQRALAQAPVSQAFPEFTVPGLISAGLARSEQEAVGMGQFVGGLFGQERAESAAAPASPRSQAELIAEAQQAFPIQPEAAAQIVRIGAQNKLRSISEGNAPRWQTTAQFQEISNALDLGVDAQELAEQLGYYFDESSGFWRRLDPITTVGGYGGGTFAGGRAPRRGGGRSFGGGGFPRAGRSSVGPFNMVMWRIRVG